jgi:hypothetical protein
MHQILHKYLRKKYKSHKLTGVQLNYTMTEKELLSSIECLKIFHNLLFGQRMVVVWTNHKNVVTEATTISQSQCIQCWRLILEVVYGPFIFIISRERKIVQLMHKVAYPRLIQTKSALAQMPKMVFLNC